MLVKLSLKQSMVLAVPVQPPLKLTHHEFCTCKFRSSANDSSTDRKLPFKFPLQWKNFKGKFNDFDADDVKKSLNTLLSRTQNFVNEVTSPFVKTEKLDDNNDVDYIDSEDILVVEHTIPSKLLDGNLSLAANISIEQFSWMDGLTGQKMQKLFEAIVPKSVHKDARTLVEYCCFRFLSRNNSDIHPCLEELSFRRLIFITMLAWEKPYRLENDSYPDGSEEASLQVVNSLMGLVCDSGILPNIISS